MDFQHDPDWARRILGRHRLHQLAVRYLPVTNELRMLLKTLRKGKCLGPSQIQVANLIDEQADQLNRLAEAFVIAYTARMYDTFQMAGMTPNEAEARIKQHLLEMNPIERLMRGKAGVAFEHLRDPKWSG